jgi:hypothetical protein
MENEIRTLIIKKDFRQSVFPNKKYSYIRDRQQNIA